MTILQPPGYLQAGTYDAAIDRQYLNTMHLYRSHTDFTRGRAGVLPEIAAWSAPITVSGLNITIGPFRMIVENQYAANAGEYRVVSTANEVRTMGASSPTQNRIDLIGVQVRDAFYSGSDNNADVIILPGTPTAGTPSEPVMPAGFWPLYRLTLNANATSPSVADLRQRTGVAGTALTIFPNQVGQGGITYGETRIYPASGSLPVRHVFWGEDSVWHGMTTFNLEFGSWLITSSAANRAIASVSIPDPGYPYKLDFGIIVHAGFDGTNGWHFTARDGTGSGGTIYARGAWETRDPDNAFTGTFGVPVVGGKSGVLNGARTVTLWAERKFGAATQGVSISGESYGTVRVVPV